MLLNVKTPSNANITIFLIPRFLLILYREPPFFLLNSNTHMKISQVFIFFLTFFYYYFHKEFFIPLTCYFELKIL